MKSLSLAALLLAAAFSIAQSPAPPKPADPPAAKIPLASSPAKDALYAAIHKKDQADKSLTELNLKLAQIQQQANQQFDALQKQTVAAQAALDEAEKKAFEAAHLDPAKFTLDHETMEFTPKPEPAKKP